MAPKRKATHKTSKQKVPVKKVLENKTTMENAAQPGTSTQNPHIEEKQVCIYQKCSNLASADLAECDGEFCSYDCAMKHCKDIFTTWQLLKDLESDEKED